VDNNNDDRHTTLVVAAVVVAILLLIVDDIINCLSWQQKDRPTGGGDVTSPPSNLVSKPTLPFLFPLPCCAFWWKM